MKQKSGKSRSKSSKIAARANVCVVGSKGSSGVHFVIGSNGQTDYWRV